MAPSPAKRKYTQRYCKAWERFTSFKGWLKAVNDDDTKAFCSYCSKILIAHKKSLLVHAETAAHKKADINRLECVKIPKITELVNVKMNDKIKRAELRIACFIAEHCSLNSVDASQQFKSNITDLAVAFKAVCGNIDETIKEWNLLHRLEIKANDSDEYWANIIDLNDANGDGRFKHISKLVVSLLSLPFSNASVERAFSVVTVIKDKLRNRMSVKTADAIMRVRFSSANGCAKFEPSQRMIKMFATENVYKSNFFEDVLNAFVDINE